MTRNLASGIVAMMLITTIFSQRAYADPPQAAKSPATAKAAEGGPAPENAKPEASVTEHSARIGDQTIAYTATAGTLILRDEKDVAIASMGYVAYVRKGTTDPSRRPITFAYNGGPGSSSIWLHMGALGPRRVVTADAAATPPPPYQVVDNGYSILDVTDLVMIDPVGTGLSHAVGKKEDKDFWSVDADISSVGRFIVQFVTDNDRWNSPKYLLGESYGTTRSAGVVNLLQSEYGMAFNGVVLVSVALDLEAIHDAPHGNDRPFPLYLPTYAAVAWYHHALPERPERLLPFLDEVRAYAMGPYTAALNKGDSLTDQEIAAVAEQLHRYTGLSADYVKKANLRVREGEFTQELLREHRETVGRLDARFLGTTPDPLAEDAQYDPQESAISPAFTAAFMDYYHRELKVGREKTYTVETEVWRSWDFKHRVPGEGRGFPQLIVNTGVDLAAALMRAPSLRVLALNGYFDLATPFLATEYMMSHLGLPRELSSHVEMKYYEAGHMMYLHEADLAKMKADIGAFINATSRSAGGAPPR